MHYSDTQKANPSYKVENTSKTMTAYILYRNIKILGDRPTKLKPGETLIIRSEYEPAVPDYVNITLIKGGYNE